MLKRQTTSPSLAKGNEPLRAIRHFPLRITLALCGLVAVTGMSPNSLGNSRAQAQPYSQPSNTLSSGTFKRSSLPREHRPLVEAEILRIDTRHPSLQTTRREPQRGPVTVVNASSPGIPGFKIEGMAKTITARKGLIWVDLYFVNETQTAYLDLEATLSSASPVIDISEDPFSETLLTAPKALGGIAAQGVSHLAFALKESTSPAEITVSLKGTRTHHTAQNSSPIVTSPAGDEVWAALSDADEVAIVDTATDATVERVRVPKGPSSVAITPDGSLVLVTSSTANTLVVIDRKSRNIVQQFGESQGVGRDPRHIVLTPDGRYAFVSSYVSDEISRWTRAENGFFVPSGKLSVGRRPTGLSITQDSKSLFVAHFLPRGVTNDNETWVSQIPLDSFRNPYEIVWRDIGNAKESQCFTKRFGEGTPPLQFEGVATQFAGVFLPPAAPLGWIPGLRTGPVAIWEFAPDRKIPGVTRATFSPAFVFYMNTGAGGKGSVKLHPQIVDVPDANPEFLKCAKLDYDTESVVSTPVPGETNAIFSNGAAIPTGSTALSETGVIRFVAFTPGGRRALTLSYTSDELQVYDAVTQQHLTQSNLKLSGSNPMGLALSRDGRKGYVLYQNSLFLSVLDLSAYADPKALPAATTIPYEYRRTERANNSFLTESRLVRFLQGVPRAPAITERAQIPLLDRDPLPPEVRRGRILFESSNPEKYPQLSGSRQSSCVTCHPGGGHDGTIWGTMEGERRTLSLHGGVADRGWLHQSGTHKDIREFVDIVVPERLGGTGLSSSDYDALATYVGWHIPKLQSPVVDPEQALRGRQIFERSCASCHAGPTLSGGMADSNDPWRGGASSGPLMVDIGTGTASAGVLIPSFFTSRLPAPANEIYDLIRGDRDLGPTDPVEKLLGFRERPDRKRGQIRPPALTNVSDYSVFFHDGRYSSLPQVVDYLGEVLNLDLNETEKADLIAFLKTL